MEKKKLSDFDFEKCIYMSVGPHVKVDSKENESFEKIISRKACELDCGFSLWADSRSPIIHINDVFDRDDVIYVLMSETGKSVKSEGTLAKYYIELDGDNREPKAIPEKIKAVYSKKNSKKNNFSYALCVEKYYEIDEQDNIFNKREYNRLKKDGISLFFNGFELLEKKPENNNINKLPKIICNVAKLKYPFCVKISKEKGNLK